MTPKKLKYSNHPQKFDNPDPKLQKEWEDLKEVLCDNEYMMGYKIMVGQKINFSTVWNILTTKHTDTSNIYSHLIFGFFFTYRAFAFNSKFELILVNLLCALTFFMSAFYHTFRNYSRRWYDLCLTLDVSGIGIQIFAYLITDTINFFKDDHPDLMRNYLIFFCILFVVSLVSVPFILKYKLYFWRTFMFTIISMLCIPLIMHHIWLCNGIDEKLRRFLPLRAAIFFWQGVGLCFRSSHIPERFFPRTIFQYVFHSHFWFHIAGSVGSYFGCLSCEVYR
ncbi:hemolysin-III related family protein [Tritrichomonas foetus]|uniref:Hemolysin-III related family protein n=1 Tax=Tritrichomonas foetus TaxID=1144522 RepID=A0A1J4JF15_9EUKA|nr:hemolysin-III related family protein [Tritrichomonas foetus]|eukprot:OHS96045.1 hemolysin-III related family protein [Tritrichomonas foetus]